EAAQRKPGKILAAGEEDDEQNSEHEAGNGVADDDHAARPDIEGAAVFHRFADAERNRNEIGEQRRPEAERDRYRQLLRDKLDHRLTLVEAGAEIEAQIILQHDPETLGRRLVETVDLVELFDDLGIEAARAAILIGGGRGA